MPDERDAEGSYADPDCPECMKRGVLEELEGDEREEA